MKNIFLLSSALIALSLPAMAEDHHHHHHHGHSSTESGWYGHVDSRTYVTSIYDAEETDEEVSDTFTHSHLSSGYNFGNSLSVNGMVALEGHPAGHSGHGHNGSNRSGDHFFDDHPLYIGQLTVNYDTDHFGGYVGKFNPKLGLGPHNAPGWWGMLVFHEFEIRERLGFGGYAAFDAHEMGQHRLDLSTFYTDTSFLQQSTLYNRADRHHSDGGAGNTEDFSSYSLNLSGEFLDGQVGYYLGHAHQGVDQAGEDDENRLVFGLQGHMPVTDDIDLSLMGDITDIDHLGGEADHDRTLMTVGFDAIYADQWHLGGTYTAVDNRAPDATEGMDGRTVQVSVGYDITPEWRTDLGYLQDNAEGETSDRAGLLIHYTTEF